MNHRSVIPAYTYDPENYILGSDLAPELLTLVPRDSWDTDMTPEEHVKGIARTGRFTLATLEQVIYLSQSAAAKILRRPHMLCGRHSYLHVAEMYSYTNQRGGGTLAIGRISGLDLFGHATRHRVLIARLDTGAWIMADAAFAANPDMGRWLRPVHGRNLFSLEME